MIGPNGVHPDRQIFVCSIGPDGRCPLVQVALRIDGEFCSSGDQSALNACAPGILPVTGPSHQRIIPHNGNPRILLPTRQVSVVKRRFPGRQPVRIKRFHKHIGKITRPHLIPLHPGCAETAS
jgi:hypothetical protein